MKWKLTLLTLLTTLVATVPSPANASLSFGVRPAFPRPDNERTESIFVHTAEPGTVINEGVRVINNSGEEKHLLLYARDSAPSTGGGFACGQISDASKGVGSWIRFDLSTFIVIDEDTTVAEGEIAGEVAEEIPEQITVVPPTYVDGVTLGSVPGSVDITIPPGKDLLVPFVISVPTDAEVGESNGCILIQEVKSQETDSGVSLSMRSGLRVAMTVPGDIERKLVFTSFTKRRKDGSIYFMPSIKNTGNVSVDTDVTVDVRYFFGKQHEQFGGQFPILRGEVYDFNFEMKRPFWGGLYSARAGFSYDLNPEAQVGMNTGSALTTTYSKRLWFVTVPTVTAGAIEIGVLLLFAISLAISLRTVRVYRLRKQWVPYTVRKNEALSDFAERIHTNKTLLARVNAIRAPYLIYRGQILFVPNAISTESKPRKPRAKKIAKKPLKKPAPKKKTTKRRPRLTKAKDLL